MSVTTYPLDVLPAGAVPRSVSADPVRIGDRAALRVSLQEELARTGQLGVDYGDRPTFVVVDHAFTLGTVEVDVLSRLTPNAPDYARGFAGLAYHLTDGGDRFESVYVRPTNGARHTPPSPRDQRAVQYFAYPEWPYDRLRESYPDGRYEAPADVGLGEWLHLQVDVAAERVTVSVDGTTVLVVTEPKARPVSGRLGLFVDIGTEAYFADLVVTPG